MKNKKKVIIPAVILVCAALAGYYFFKYEQQLAKEIKVSGNIEATDVRLSFRIPGKISKLLTDEGRSIKKGEIVAELDTDELERIVAADEAALQAATLVSDQAQDDYRRLEKLFEAGAISEQKRNTSRTNADSAKANADALNARLELSRTRLGFARLASPIDGFVLVKSAEVGEVVQAGAPVFTAADLKDVWLTAYINETDLGRVKLNQWVEVKTDTYPDKKYRGTVSFISQESEFTPKQIQTNEERVKLVYRIKVKLENPDDELKPGMPADGYILE